MDAFGTNRADNDERMIFYARGTMETARKLRWEPEIIQVSGWVSALIPMYLKCLFADGPSFARTHLVYTVLPGEEVAEIDPAIFDKLKVEGVADEVLDRFRGEPLDHSLLHKMAIAFADAVVFQTETPDPALVAYAEAAGKPWSHFTGEGDFADDYDALYKSLMA